MRSCGVWQAGKARSVDGGECPCSASTPRSSLTGRRSESRRARPRRRRCSSVCPGGRTRSSPGSVCRTGAGKSSIARRRRVAFRELTARDLAHYVGSGEWEGRAGGYAIQGLGASLVERIEGDYLNVVGLPAALLVRLLAERFPGTYGFG